MMKKRILAGALTLALCLGSAWAVGEEKFPAVNTYPGYGDVKENDWFYGNAKLCYEIGLMNGTGEGVFSPNGTVSLAESAAVAARLGSAYPNNPAIPQQEEGEPWYQPYVAYFSGLLGDSQLTRMLIEAPTKSASRLEFFYLLSTVIPEGELAAINSITSLPDIQDESVLGFYNAGILTGKDKYGTFDAAGTLTRAECAAMVSRVARPGLRLAFVPEDYSPFTAAYLTPDTVMFSNGLTAQEYLIAVNNAISAWEAALGDEFNWHYVWTDEKSVLTHVKEDVLTALGVTAEMGTQAYQDLDVQVYYSRLIDLKGGPLG